MKKNLFCLLVSFCSLIVSAQDLNVMTFNIRYNTTSDSLNAWTYRKDKVASQILFHQVHLLGVQEALHEQMTDLQQRLPRYRSVGGGRDDGKEKGEYSAIFYDTTRLQLLETKMFWLSETPGVPGSNSWDAAITRMVTWARFRDRKTKKLFYAFNTHFDHIGQVARRESAKIVLNRVKEIAGNTPVVFTGDFNARPSDEPIIIITDKTNPLHLIDSKEISQTPHYGPAGTFNGFQSKERDDDPIDYIFLKGKWKVIKHATISQIWWGRFASDHFAVMATLIL
ncbi:MAG TPA: endonuclease/exonuclease/phosphatase family protein [Chitinophagaceae bacterium]|nr:endonuclease/exonuclease/phosphatase family protein [Chitinophagaceae bacterium]